MRKYPERERVRLPLQVFLRKKKRKKKLGHWMFRVFVSGFGVRNIKNNSIINKNLFSLCNNLSDSLSYSLSLSLSLFVSPACVCVCMYMCARANPQTRKLLYG